MERALTRAAGGLTARQRAWAERHASYTRRPRDRAGRQVLVTWTYRRARIDSTRARWTVLADDAAAALAAAEREFAETTAAVLRAWGPEAPAVTATPRRQLRRWAEHTGPLAERSDN